MNPETHQQSERSSRAVWGGRYSIHCSKTLEEGERYNSPALVKPSSAFLIQVLSKDGLQRSKATRSLHVTNHSNHHHRRGLDNRHCFNNFMFVTL